MHRPFSHCTTIQACSYEWVRSERHHLFVKYISWRHGLKLSSLLPPKQNDDNRWKCFSRRRAHLTCHLYIEAYNVFFFLIWIISVSMYTYHQSISFLYCQNSRSILFLDISIWHWLQLKMDVGFLLYVYTFCHVSARYFGAVHATIEQFINISLIHC